MRAWFTVGLLPQAEYICCVFSFVDVLLIQGDWTYTGLCSTHRDTVAQIASLYYSFAVDVISDIMSRLPCDASRFVSANVSI